MRESPWRHLLDIVCVAAFLTLVLCPWGDIYGRNMSLSAMLQAPSLDHLLGTDNLGRDLLVRCADAVRGAVLPLWSGVVVATALGFIFALFSIAMERRSGWGLISFGMQTGAAMAASIPVGIAAFTWAVVSEKGGLWPVLFAVSALFFVRVFLQTMDLYRHDKNLGYWEAHRALGGSIFLRLIKYGLQGSWQWRLADGFGFHLRAAVAIEASLSYLGFGIQEPSPSFGNMLASHFDIYLKGEFYSLVVIVAMLALTAAFPGSLVAMLKLANQALWRKAPKNGALYRTSEQLQNPQVSP